MILTKPEDFVIPTLSILNDLGGSAFLSDVEDEFYSRYSKYLDPAIGWQRITVNHNKPLWKDYCGSRIAYRFLIPRSYIRVERHGGKGSLWVLTEKGRQALLSEKNKS